MDQQYEAKYQNLEYNKPPYVKESYLDSVKEVKDSGLNREHVEQTVSKGQSAARLVVGLAKLTQVPSLDGISARCLKGPFGRAGAILLSPTLSDVSNFLRKALLVVYTKFNAMAPELSFLPSSKRLCCEGCYTQNFETCTFKLEIWKNVRTSSDCNQNICELHRSSYGGRESFSDLVSQVASCLKHESFATQYADGNEIVGELYIDDTKPNLFPTYLISKGSVRAMEEISLDEDLVTLLSSHVAEGTYPMSSETLRLLAQVCASSRENCEMLLESDKLGEALVTLLSDTSEASSCLNALKLIELGAAAPKNAFVAIARSMIVHCGVGLSSGKRLRSQAIENAALGAMKKLMGRLRNNEPEETFRVIEKVLSGKIPDQLVGELSVICLQKSVKPSKNFE